MQEPELCPYMKDFCISVESGNDTKIWLKAVECIEIGFNFNALTQQELYYDKHLIYQKLHNLPVHLLSFH